MAPYNYNGNDNLIVEISVTAASGATSWRANDALGIGHAQLLWGSTASATGTPYGYGMHTKLRFNGGQVNVITPPRTGSTAAFLSVNDGQYAFKYNPAQLGTKGTISKLACQINADVATDTDFPDTKIVLGHASATALTTTYADNMVDATTVYNATHTIPGGKLIGDWTEFNLSSSFNYNGVDDLIVHVFSGVGAGTVSCKLVTGSLPSVIYSTDPASATGGASNYLMNLGLSISP